MKTRTSRFNTKSSFAGLLLLTMLSACASLPENIDQQPSTAFTDTVNTPLGDSIKVDIAEHPGQRRGAGFEKLRTQGEKRLDGIIQGKLAR
jgi:hypothetical protein